MHRRIWLLAGAAAAVLVMAAGASATSRTAAAPAPDATPAAAPFAQAWAHVPRTPAARKAKSIAVGVMEQDLSGSWNTALSCCSLAWANWAGLVPTTRGAYLIDNNVNYKLDLATKVTATKTSLSYTIRNDAFWNWGGKKIPVTYKDFVYTWQQMVNPKNDIASRIGYDQITGYTHKGQKQVTFKWKKPFADYRDLFGFVYPAQALAGMDFNKVWQNCVCGSDGKPVSDGPYLMTNYTKGAGVTLKANPDWYGTKPALKEIDWKIITDTNSEIQALRGGEADFGAPQPTSALTQLRGVSGIKYTTAPGNYLEHIELSLTSKATNVLLRAPWMRQALMLGMNRQGLVNALFKDIAPGLKPIDSIIFPATDKQDYKAPYAKWNYNPAKAIALLKKHGCTGGPSQPTDGNTSYFTCHGLPAKFFYTTTAGNTRRETSEAIFKANLGAIGIQIVDNFLPASVMFGATVLEAGNFDLMEFAYGGVIDPGAWTPIWGCGGDQNYTQYCNRKATNLMTAGLSELDQAKRAQDYVKADQMMSAQIPAIPLYALPDVVVFRSGLKNVVNNPVTGLTWNVEDWKWTS